MKGRKPNLTVIEGGQTGRVPKPSAALPKCGKAEWTRVAPVLHRRGLLGPATLSTVERYCREVGMADVFAAVLERDGYFLDADGRKVAHPAFRMMQDAAREARLLAVELGLTRGVGAPLQDDPGNAKKGGWADDSDLLA